MSVADMPLADVSAAIRALPLTEEVPASSRYRARRSAILRGYLERRARRDRTPEQATHQVQFALPSVRQHREGTEEALREAIAGGEIREVMRAMRAVGGGVAVWHHREGDWYECRWTRRYGRYTGRSTHSDWAAVVEAAERGLAEEPKGGQG